MLGGGDAVLAVFIHLAKLTPLGCIRAVFGNTQILAQILGRSAGSAQTKCPKTGLYWGGLNTYTILNTSTSIWAPNRLLLFWQDQLGTN